MNIVVRYFASLPDYSSDTRTESLSLPEQATITEVRLALGERYPELIPLLDIGLVLVNGRYVFAGGQPLHDDDHVELLPPICGG
jgi:molybdopterin converting factor small subunit